MARPLVLPTWSTTANYPAGALDWSGQPTRSQPSAGLAALGFTPNTDVPAEVVNWLYGVLSDWVGYLDATVNQPAFGDGSDGAYTLDGTQAAVAGLFSKSGNVYTLLRDAFFTNLTVTGAGVMLKPGGFRCFVKGTLTTVGGGSVNANGNAGSGATAGAGWGNGTINGAYAGGAGGLAAGTGTAGSGPAGQSLGGAGSLGAAGAGTGATSAAGGAVQLLASEGSPRAYSPSTVGAVLSVATWRVLQGGGSGGGGGGNGFALQGGGGGGGGGVLALAARYMVLASAADISAIGGQGGASGNAASASSGGGGAGGGGLVILAYGSKLLAGGGLPVFTSAVNCAGGPASTGAGNNSAAGSPGTFVEIGF